MLKKIIMLLVLIALGFTVYNYFNKSDAAAIVNGKVITRKDLVSELEKREGKQTLNAMVIQVLIVQEAQKRKINVTAAEVDSEIKKIKDNLKEQGQNLDNVLQYQGLTLGGFSEQIKIQKLVEKMILAKEKVSNKEIDDYLAKNKDQDSKEKDEKKLRANAKLELEQQIVKSLVNSWISDLQKKAKITYIAKY